MDWGGRFEPIRKAKSQSAFPGTHTTNPLITVGQPDYGSVQIYVEFNHTCDWENDGHITLPPSNSKTYSFDYELDEFDSGQDSAAADLQAELDNLHAQGKSMKWLQDNLAAGTITRQLTGPQKPAVTADDLFA